MLVLSRRATQAIVIGPDIVVRVLDIRGDQVRIGVDAPRSVAVNREEVAAEIRRSNEEAAQLGAVASLDLPRPGTRAIRLSHIVSRPTQSHCESSDSVTL